MKIYLASGSPRRKELLCQIGIEYTVRVSEIEEVMEGIFPGEIVENLSGQKAEAVFDLLEAQGEKDFCVIGADTVVAYKDTIMGKPVDEDDARRMLHNLSGNVHQVYTGVSLYINRRNDGPEVVTFHEKTDVEMYELTDKQIDDYIATGEPMDKAGAYGIQAKAAAFVKKIDGEYYNVVGLPIGRLHQELCKLNVL